MSHVERDKGPPQRENGDEVRVKDRTSEGTVEGKEANGKKGHRGKGRQCRYEMAHREQGRKEASGQRVGLMIGKSGTG